MAISAAFAASAALPLRHTQCEVLSHSLGRPRRLSALTKRPRVVLRSPRPLSTPSAQLSAFSPSSRDGPDALRDVSEPVLRAVERLARQPRVTVPDIAASAGIDITAAQDGLVTLASVTGAAIDVTDSGELGYRFPTNVRQQLRQKSLRSALRQTWDKAFPVLFSAVRLAFGAFLVFSIVLTFLAIIALSSSSRSDNENDNRRGGGGGMFFGPRLFGPNIFDVMFYSRQMNRGYGYGASPVYDRRGRQVVQQKPEMSFLESVYSFVFGDRDPNGEILERRWRKVAAVIRANDGCVAAEQVAPFLDLPESYSPDRRSTNVDEGFMLPVLQRFHGHPEVTDDGDLIYVFPDFGTTGSTSGGSGSVDVLGRGTTMALREEELKLTSASSTQKLTAGALGALNVGGVLTLGSMLSRAVPRTVDSATILSAARFFYPALLAYALSFVLIPTARFFWQKGKNARIRARNASRARASIALARPSASLRSKLAAAFGKRVGSNVLRNDSVVYSSDQGADQPGIRREQTKDFDRRLSEREPKEY